MGATAPSAPSGPTITRTARQARSTEEARAPSVVRPSLRSPTRRREGQIPGQQTNRRHARANSVDTRDVDVELMAVEAPPALLGSIEQPVGHGLATTSLVRRDKPARRRAFGRHARLALVAASRSRALPHRRLRQHSEAGRRQDAVGRAAVGCCRAREAGAARRAGRASVRLALALTPSTRPTSTSAR